MSAAAPSSPAPHALVVGGTGMLRRVCLHLVGPRGGAGGGMGTGGGAWNVSVIARTVADLRSLAKDAGPPNVARKRGKIVGVPTDYTDTARLALAVRVASIDRGPIRIVVAYIQPGAPEALATIAGLVGNDDDPCHFFHVVGSAELDPAKIDGGRDSVAMLPNILYRRIVLGFVAEPRGSRWLTNDEIARGVIDAIKADEPESVVGTVRPWSARPGW